MSENAEVENLFLDCIDEWKKEIIRKKYIDKLVETRVILERQ